MFVRDIVLLILKRIIPNEMGKVLRHSQLSHPLLTDLARIFYFILTRWSFPAKCQMIMEVLRKRYRVFTLKDWLITVVLTVSEDISEGILIRHGDNASYISLMTDVYVCEERSTSQHVKLQKSEASSQRELVIKTIENILKKHGFGKNILTDGFCLLSQDKFAQQCGVNVESKYPNSCVNRLFYSTWDTLLSRIGDTVMMYMLENTSLFYKITDTCFVQLTGLSVNNVAESVDLTDEVEEIDGDKSRCDSVVKVLGVSSDVEMSDAECWNKKNISTGETIAMDAIDNEDAAKYPMRNDARPDITNEHSEEDIKLFDDINAVDKEKFCDQEDELNRTVECDKRKVVFENKAGAIFDQRKQGVAENRKNAMWKNKNDLCKDGFNKLSRSSVDNAKDTIVLRTKWKRKYQQISDERFQLLRLSSEMFAKAKLCEGEDEDHSFIPGQSTVVKFVGLEISGTSRKGKISERLNEEMTNKYGNEIDAKRRKIDECENYSGNSPKHVVKADDRQLEHDDEIFSKKRKLIGYPVNVRNVDNHENGVTTRPGSVSCYNADTLEETNGQETSSKTAAVEFTEHCRLKHCKKKKVTVKMKKNKIPAKNIVIKDKATRNKKNSPKCCMFSYHLTLSRSSVLFTRNPRGTFLKSATLSTMTSCPDGILSLYKDIFCDSQIATDQCCINVKIPELKDFITLSSNLNHKISVPSQTSTGQELVKLSCLFLDHPSFCSNDSMFPSSVILGSDACKPFCSTTRTNQLVACPELSSSVRNPWQPANQNDVLLKQATFKNVLHSNLSVYKTSLCLKQVTDLNKSSDQKLTFVSNSCLLSAIQGKDKSSQRTGRQMDKLLNETIPENDSLSKMLAGNNNMDNNLLPNSSNFCLNQLLMRNSQDLKDTSVTNDSPNLNNKKCVVKAKETVPLRDDFGYVLITNKPACAGYNETLQFTKYKSNCMQSKKEKLLAKRTEKLLADKYCNDVNGHLNVLNVSHESDISTNASHDSRKSVIHSQAIENLGTTFQSSSESSKVSDRHTGSANAGRSFDRDVPMLNNVVPLLKEFIDKHRSCPYVRFLNHHCPVVKKCFKKTNIPGKIKGIGRRYMAPSVSQLLSNHIHNRKVYLFLRLCVLHVLPDGLLGERHNFNVVMRNISRIISLGRHEKVTLGQLVRGMRTKEVRWLSEVMSDNTRLYLLACVMHWWFSNYVFAVLRTFFYVTDTSFLRYKLLYYRQSTWNQLHILGMKGLMKRGILRSVTEKCCVEMIESRRSLGVSSLRFLPKPKSLRPIMNMGRSVQVTKSQMLSVNKLLSSLHSVLTYLKKQKPSLISHGKLGMDDIYHAWKDYVTLWRGIGSPNLCFVKTDISNCYDSIDQKKLCSIIETLLQDEVHDEEFVVRKYFTVRMKSGSSKKQFHRVVAPLSEFNPDFVSYCKHLVKKKNLQNVIFVDAAVYQHETSATLISLLRSLLLNTIVKIGSHYYIQSAGISQGSVLSTLLCNLYYARMEKQYLRVGDDELLMRIVDDYLYVTPNREHAETFVDKMLAGVPEYNCVTNKEKVLMNFNHELYGESLPLITGEWFPWCGVQMHMTTLEVALDCSRYSGFNIRDTLTMELSNNPGKCLKEKMVMSVSQKYHAIYVDTIINTEKQMLTNIYQIFIVTSLKLHAAIRQLPHKERAEKNSQYYLGVVQAVSGVMLFLVRRLLHVTDSIPDMTLASNIQWLCLRACYTTFRRHHSQYATLLKLLEKSMKQIQKRMSTNNIEMLMALVVEEYPLELMKCLP